MSRQLPQQKATTTFLLAGLLEKGHTLLPALTFLTSPFTSVAAFFTHLEQQTLKVATLSAFTALPEKGHSSLTGATFLAPVKKKIMERIPIKFRIFLNEIFMYKTPMSVSLESQALNITKFRQLEVSPLPQLP